MSVWCRTSWKVSVLAGWLLTYLPYQHRNVNAEKFVRWNACDCFTREFFSIFSVPFSLKLLVGQLLTALYRMQKTGLRVGSIFYDVLLRLIVRLCIWDIFLSNYFSLLPISVLIDVWYICGIIQYTNLIVYFAISESYYIGV